MRAGRIAPSRKRCPTSGPSPVVHTHRRSLECTGPAAASTRSAVSPVSVHPSGRRVPRPTDCRWVAEGDGADGLPRAISTLFYQPRAGDRGSMICAVVSHRNIALAQTGAGNAGTPRACGGLTRLRARRRESRSLKGQHKKSSRHSAICRVRQKGIA
jgi:hypothetical protein